MKALVDAFNQEKALVGAFSVIVKTGCRTDGSFYSTSGEGEELLPACINSNGVMIGGGRSPAWDLPTSPPSDHLPPAASEDGAWEGYSVKLVAGNEGPRRFYNHGEKIIIGGQL